MKKRGVNVDHASVQRWVYKFIPLIYAQMRKQKREVWTSWSMDETYIKVKGILGYLYRVVDRFGCTVDFLFTKGRQRMSA